MIGRDCAPVSITTLRFIPKPSRITAHCKIFLDTNLMPFSILPLSFRNKVTIMPAKMAITAPPMIGNCFPKNQEGMAMIIQTKMPHPFSFTNLLISYFLSISLII